MMSEKIGTVQEVLETYKKAVNERDSGRFLKMYASDVHIYDCWGSWECKGIDAWRDNVCGWFNDLKENGDVLKVSVEDVVMEDNTNLAFVHCAVTYAAYKEGTDEKLRQMTNRFTFGLKRVNGSWLITHEHSSLPINMEDGKGMFNLR